MQGLNTSNCYPELEDWNKQANRLVQDIECTLNGFTDLLNQSSRTNKENKPPGLKKIPIRASHTLQEQSLSSCYNKSDPFTVKMMIRAGISYLRNNSPKPLTESENHFSNPPSFENSLPFSLQPIHPIKIIVKHKEKKSKEKPENKKKRPAKRSKSVIKDEFCKCASRDNKLNTSSRGRSLETSIVLKKSDRPKSAKRS